MNTSISPAQLPATPVAQSPESLPIGDAGLSFSDRVRADGLDRGPNTEPMPAEQKRERATSRAALPINDLCLAAERSTRAEAIRIHASECGKPPSLDSLQAEFVAVSLAWFAVLTATALGGLL